MQHTQLQPQGHLTLKSSVYAIGNAKLVTQRLIQDHMSAHYKNLLNAKPAIDTKVPKSSVTSVKARDTYKRKNGGYPIAVKSRPASAAASRTISRLGDNGSTGRNDFVDELQSILSYQEIADMNPKMAEELDKRRGQAPTPTWSPSTDIQLSLTNPASLNGSVTRARSSLSHYGLGGSGIVYKTGRHRQVAGDHLERFAERFRESGEFQPRLLKKTAQSWLAASKHYVPPRQYRVTRSDDSPDMAESSPSTTQLEPSSTQPETSSKPPLPKENNVSKQATPRQVTPRKNNVEKTNSGNTLDSVPEKEKPTETSVENVAIANATTAFEKLNDDGCVKFVAEVTQDILNRGVFTNKAIENIIQEHYFKNKGKINERKLQLAMSSLREDFGINETGLNEKDAFIKQEQYYSSANHNNFKRNDVISAKPVINEVAVTVPSSQAEPASTKNRITDAKPADFIDQVNGDEELNKTVDELIAKINELETTRPSENHETAPKISDTENSSAKEEEQKVAAAVEQPHEEKQTADKPEIQIDEATKSQHDETGGYEEDFE